MSYQLYKKKPSPSAEQVITLFREQGLNLIVKDTESLHLTKEHVQDLLDMLGMWAVDLVDRSDPLWIDGCLNEESDDAEIIDFITKNPSVMKDCIVIKNNSVAMIASPPEAVFSLF